MCALITILYYYVILLCICIYVLYICVHIYIYIYTHIHINTYIYIYVYIYIYICTYRERERYYITILPIISYMFISLYYYLRHLLQLRLQLPGLRLGRRGASLRVLRGSSKRGAMGSKNPPACSNPCFSMLGMVLNLGFVRRPRSPYGEAEQELFTASP